MKSLLCKNLVFFLFFVVFKQHLYFLPNFLRECSLLRALFDTPSHTINLTTMTLYASLAFLSNHTLRTISADSDLSPPTPAPQQEKVDVVLTTTQSLAWLAQPALV